MPSEREKEAAVAHIAGLLATFALENGGSISLSREYRAAAQRIVNAGFLNQPERRVDADQDDRLLALERRVSAIEGWTGLSREMP